jgi:2-C-methyl-D-erythritol 2,4-cyclodiphosphate synthase
LKLIPKWKAVGVGHKSVSTLRFDGKIIPREKVWLMETPQIVAKKILCAGVQFAERNKIEVTDELQLAELVGEKVKVIAASANNFKITRLEDLNKFSMCNVQCAMRIGFGHDSHKFSEKQKPLILGGFQISPTGGLEANSDGDVILHALTNAISTALGGGSLSTFSDAMCRRGIKDSKKYLAVVLAKMKLENFEIENLSISIEGKKPKLEKHFYKICQSLSKILLLEGSRIGLVATTGEGLTSFGRGEGLQVFAVILLKK